MKYREIDRMLLFLIFRFRVQLPIRRSYRNNSIKKIHVFIIIEYSDGLQEYVFLEETAAIVRIMYFHEKRIATKKTHDTIHSLGDKYAIIFVYSK